MQKEKLLKHFIDIYNSLYRKGINRDEALLITVHFVYETYRIIHNIGCYEVNKYCEQKIKRYKISENLNFIDNFKKYKKQLELPEFLYIVDSLITIWEEKETRDKHRTPKSTINIIQELAKHLSSGPYQDLSAGTGSLLRGFSNIRAIQDIDKNMLNIARNIYNMVYGNNLLENDFSCIDKDAISSPYVYKDANMYLFDPPMGDLRQKPKHWLTNKKLIDIVGTSENTKLPSEILFLINYFLEAAQDTYFIGLFPESILNRNNKEYNNLRQYLLKNSLLAVIKVQTGHIILVGINSNNIRIKYPMIPILNISGDLNSEQITYIAEHIATKDYEYEKFYEIMPNDIGSIYREIGFYNYNKEFAQIFSYRVYERIELLNMDSIPVPIIKTYEEKISKNPKEILKFIQEKENNIKNAINYIENIINELPEEGKAPEEKQWFENGITEEEKALNFFWAKRAGKSFDPETLVSKYDYKREFDAEILNNLKILKDSKRIKFSGKSTIEIYFNKTINIKTLKEDYFYTKLKPSILNNTINELINMTDGTVKDIYDNHCKYCIDNLPEEETYIINKKYQMKDLVRAFDVLEKLGLVTKKHLNKEDTKSVMALYDEYETYIPVIDKEEGKRHVY